MSGRSLRGILVAFVVFSVSSLASATGISLGSPFYLIDLSRAVAKVPGVAADVLAELEVPESDAAGILADVEATLADFPTILPVPLLGGALEISLPFDVIDTVRLSAGILNDGLVRGIADLLGAEIPQPLIDQEWSEPGFQGAVTADLFFSTYLVSAEVLKRFDLVFLGVNLGLGLDWMEGEITPAVDYEVPPDYEDRISAAVDALHLGGLTWSSLGVHGLIGFELGPPFLRLALDGRVYLPFSQMAGWWGIEVADWGWTLGLVVRF